MSSNFDTLIIGAGPAGLCTAYTLSKHGKKSLVLERGTAVGGLAKSFDLWGGRVDLGPHRFLSNDRRINDLWVEVLGDDFELVTRCTRILFDGHFYSYPLDPLNLAFTLDIFTSLKATTSFALAKLSRQNHDGPAKNLEEWFIRQFGKHLYHIFFKSYSEKLWGLSCREMDADFAGQRIRKLNFIEMIKSILPGSKGKHRTLTDVFGYPRNGAGTLYEKMAKRIIQEGSEVKFGAEVSELQCIGNKIVAVKLVSGEVIEAKNIVSTMPLTHLVKGLANRPSEVDVAVEKLAFRGTYLVYLMVDKEDIFPDQWVYIQSAHLRVGRITNFNNWGSLNSNIKGSSILCLELWSSPGDDLWHKSDEHIVGLATEDLRNTKLIPDVHVLNSKVVRIQKSYPVYYQGYKDDLKPVQNFLDTFENLSVIGRYGSYKYNNQDHSLLMGIQAAENILFDKQHNLWELNSDYEEYQEKATLPEVLEMRAADSSSPY